MEELNFIFRVKEFFLISISLHYWEVQRWWLLFPLSRCSIEKICQASFEGTSSLIGGENTLESNRLSITQIISRFEFFCMKDSERETHCCVLIAFSSITRCRVSHIIVLTALHRQLESSRLVLIRVLPPSPK